MRKNSFLAITLLITILLTGVSYAAVSSTLIINGSADFDGNFNVAFSDTNVFKQYNDDFTTENVSAAHYISGYTTGSEISSQHGKYNDTLTFRVKLLAPGDSYDVNYKITNYGTIDAKLSNLSNCDLPNDCGITIACSNIEGTVLKKNQTKEGTISITWPFESRCSQNDYVFNATINAVQN